LPPNPLLMTGEVNEEEDADSFGILC